PGFQSSVWDYDSRARAWYFHRFYPHQPDLNIMSAEVRDEIYKIVGFWLELGVSGFRIDAAPFVIEEVRPDQPIHRRYEFFGELKDFLSWRKGDAILLAEANVTLEEMPKYFGNGSRLHMLFAFLVNQYLFLSLARKKAEPLARGLGRMPKLPSLGQWAHFLRNHDELDLGRLSEAEREECYRAFMQWSDMPSAGFSRAEEDSLIHPAIMDGQFGAANVNAAAQQRDPKSLLIWMRRLIDARQSCAEVGWGELTLIETGNPALFAHRVDWNGNTTIALHNLGDQPSEVRLDLETGEAERLTEVFANRTYDTGRCEVCALDPFGYRWFRLDPLSR
ncbi:MAG: hypothetical protein JF604_14260, partial [Bradyrhizobium sp.]|nr:hypothetical protein [Bradyrhizobium sp.]